MDKDSEQDEQIRQNAERIRRNEEAIKRQTAALEQIRDHYYPPPHGWLKKSISLLAKCCCAVFAYLGIAETVDWIWSSRESGALAKKYAQTGERLFTMECDSAGAMRCYEKAVKLDPKESSYLLSYSFMKGITLCGELIDTDRPLTSEEQSRVNNALADAIAIRNIAPDDALPCILMAQSLVLNGDAEGARKAADNATALADGRAFVWVSACAVNFYAGDKLKARECLATAERLNPKLPLVWTWKGVLAIDLDKDVAAARKCFAEVTHIAPRFAVAHALLGHSLVIGDKPDPVAARAAFKRALALAPNQRHAMLGIASTYAMEGNRALAYIWLNRLIERDANFLPAYVEKAKLYIKDGNREQAVELLNKAIRLSPFMPELYRLRGNAGDIETAEQLEKELK